MFKNHFNSLLVNLYGSSTPTRSDHNFKYGEALMHLVKGYVGTGIFSMGDAMKNSGLLIGPITTFVIGMVCLHCAHLLVSLLPPSWWNLQVVCGFQVNSAHKLHKYYNLERIPDYAEVAKLAFALAAPNFPAGAFVAKLTVNVFLIMAQMGFCSCYLVFISWNIREVLYCCLLSLSRLIWGLLQLMNAYKYTTDIHWIIVLVTIPIWITCWIRTLKCLAYLSVVANFTLLTSIGIVLYYALIKPTSQCPVGLHFPGVTEFAIFFGQSIFAFEGIGLVFSTTYCTL